jgi:hypothetical protein
MQNSESIIMTRKVKQFAFSAIYTEKSMTSNVKDKVRYYPTSFE